MGKQQIIGTLQVLFAAILWGTAGTFAKYLFNNQITAYDLTQARITLSFVILFIILCLFKRSLLIIHLRDLVYVMVFGVMGLALVQFAYLLTISLTNVATAIFLEYLSPALILLYGLAVKAEKFTGKKALALLTTIFGGYLIVLGTKSGFGLKPLGLASGLISAVAFAFYSVYGKYGLAKYSAWTLLTWGSAFGALTWFIYQPPWTLLMRYDWSVWLQFLYVGVMATILPFALYFKGLERLSAFRVGIISTVEPVVGGVAAFLFLGERLNAAQQMGCILVLTGIILIQAGENSSI